MAQLTTKFLFKKLDIAHVRRRAKQGKRRSLIRAGAFIRRTARQSLRRRKKIAAPGQPPSVHAKKEPNLKTILFAYEETTGSVVIGPIEFKGRTTDAPASQLQEFGGRSVMRVKDRRGKMQRVRINISPHPFMGPAVQTEVSKGNVVSAFKDQIVGP